MIFVDSWVWMEFVFGGDTAGEAESVIQRASDPEEGGLVAPTVLTEVSYRVRSVDSETTAEDAVDAIRAFDAVDCLPLVADVAEYAADLRYKYYDRGERAFSYADAIHLATASVHSDCHTLFTGDPDFEGVDEIDVVVL